MGLRGNMAGAGARVARHTVARQPNGIGQVSHACSVPACHDEYVIHHGGRKCNVHGIAPSHLNCPLPRRPPQLSPATAGGCSGCTRAAARWTRPPSSSRRSSTRPWRWCSGWWAPAAAPRPAPSGEHGLRLAHAASRLHHTQNAGVLGSRGTHLPNRRPLSRLPKYPTLPSFILPPLRQPTLVLNPVF